MGERFTFLACDPDNVEAGAIVYEDNVPIARTYHLPGWEAADHDDLAAHMVCELRAAWDVPAPRPKPFNPENFRRDHA